MLSAFGSLTRFERMLWTSSMAVVALSYLLSPQGDVLSLAASLVGVTSLIFIAKGYVIGQVLVVVFAILYGIASYEQRYHRRSSHRVVATPSVRGLCRGAGSPYDSP